MVKDRRVYPITQHNSTVCGYPGRDFDWSKFIWDGKAIHKMRGHKDLTALIPWKDNGLIDADCEYIHVPYDFVENGTVYRVRPNESMRAGQKYRGRLVVRQTAELINDQWYWVLWG